jgi:hypothetical protein
MLLYGSELTKEDRESQLSDEFCQTPNLPEWQWNRIPGGDCHSITVTVTLNDLKCRLENMSFDH